MKLFIPKPTINPLTNINKHKFLFNPCTCTYNIRPKILEFLKTKFCGLANNYGYLQIARYNIKSQTKCFNIINY